MSSVDAGRVLSSVVVAAGLCAATGCKPDEPKSRAKSDVGVKSSSRDLRAKQAKVFEKVHGHRAEEMGEAPPSPVISAEGEIVAKFGGKEHRFAHNPPVNNVAVYADETQVGRVMLSGTYESGVKFPTIRVRVEHWRLRPDELPATVASGTGVALGDAKPKVAISLMLTATRRFESDPADAKSTVTFDSLEGRMLTGSYSATLLPILKERDEPLPVEGTFRIKIRTNGITPAKQGG